MNKRNYGWSPDVPDVRDYKFKKDLKVVLPAKVDLRPGCSPVEDQGNLGSCTANALVGALEFLERKDNMPQTDLSRLFVYYNERAIEGSVGSDSGAQIRDGVKTLAKNGVCPESLCTYDISKFTHKPSSSAYSEALKHTIVTYERLATLSDMRNCLASGFPFVFGFTVYEGFESDVVAKTGVVNLPKKNERVLGGHAVVAVGYDNATKRFLVRNSWGISWGMSGYFTIPYSYLTNKNLADDFWKITKGSGL